MGEVDCVLDPTSKFYSPAAAAAIAHAVDAASSAEVTVLAVGLGGTMEAEGRDRVNMTLPSVQRALLDSVVRIRCLCDDVCGVCFRCTCTCVCLSWASDCM